MLLSLWKTIRHTSREVGQAWLLANDLNSRLRLSFDFVLYRLLKVIDLGSQNKERTIRCSNGIILTYRLNRGDIQSIREVLLDEVYRLPFSLKPRLVVDLGANIGLTSVWLCQRYGCDKVIAVEPSPSNASLVRQNFINNKINGTVVQAAIGANDGMVAFESSKESNLGRIAQSGEQVKMISMVTLLADLSRNEVVDLVKMDIEGGEQQLLSGDLNWLKRIRAMIAEFHPELVDYLGLTKTIEQHGFRYIRANTMHQDNMDAFLNETMLSSSSDG